MKNKALGKTGLTQKDAIFEIIKKLSGELYTPDMPMKPIIKNLGSQYLLQAIVKLVINGIEDGSIPSKHNQNSSVGKKQVYAYQIVQNSLKHDKRLNGGKIGIQEARKKQIYKLIKNRVESSNLIKNMHLLHNEPERSEVDRLEIQSYIAGAKFKIILEAFKIDLKIIPQELLIELKLIESEAA